MNSNKFGSGIMNLLFVFYYPSGGVESLARQRAKALVKYGINFHFLYYEKGEGLKNIEDIPTFVTRDENAIKELISKTDYQAMIVCSDHTFLAKARNMNYKGKLIYEVQGLGSIDAAENWLSNARSIIEAHADAILYPKTPHLVHLIGKYYPEKKKFSFHNCIDTSNFKYHKTNQLAQKPIVGWIGRIEENKNWREFLEIGKSLIKSKPALKIWLFIDNNLTSPQQGSQFKKLIHKYRLKNHLTIRNNIPHAQMQHYLSSIADSGGFLCSTSKVEGFGYAIVEAMCCKCPVLTTDSDGIRSFVFHNQTGKVYTQGDINQALQESYSLMNDQVLREGICNNALIFVHSQLTPDKYASNFISMLRELGITT